MSDSLWFTLKFAGIGIIIVFGALAVIATVVALIRRADDKWQAREESQAKAALSKEPGIDTLTLVLITAAAATVLKGRFHIRRVRRLLPAGAAKGPWSMQGRAVLLGSHIVNKKRH